MKRIIIFPKDLAILYNHKKFQKLWQKIEIVMGTYQRMHKVHFRTIVVLEDKTYWNSKWDNWCVSCKITKSNYSHRGDVLCFQPLDDVAMLFMEFEFMSSSNRLILKIVHLLITRVVLEDNLKSLVQSLQSQPARIGKCLNFHITPNTGQ